MTAADQETEPSIRRVRTRAGDQAWLATRHDDVRRLLGDARVGRSHPHPERAARISDSILLGGPTENFETEREDHARMRALLTPFFSARRMEALGPRVEALVDGLLDDLAARTPPADLHEALSFPLPVLVICELLGVPYEDRERFRAWSLGMSDLDDRELATESMGRLFSYMGELVARRRLAPADDVISGLCAVEGGALADAEIAQLAAVLLFAGHETTVVRIDLGTLQLLRNPDQRDALLRDPSLIQTAVEEILRTTSTGGGGGGGLPRYPRTDVEVGGVTIPAGDAVVLDLSAANRDEAAFPNPDRFDVARQPNPHVAFGYGARYCIGAPLARIELRAVFERLLPRFPGLRLAVPEDRLRARDRQLAGGLFELPVTW
jgi:pentalenolactone synthase